MTPHLARFARQSGAQAAVDEQYHPAGTGDTPMVMPMHRVQIGSAGLAYDELTPLVMPDGRMVPATAPHTWFQLYAAGRP
jgi:hypothetical protein